MSDVERTLLPAIPDPDDSEDYFEPKPQAWPPKYPSELENFALDRFKTLEDETTRHHTCHYYSCCFNFSTRAALGKNSHPAKPVTWRQFRKDHAVTDPESFAKALQKIALGLPNFWKRVPAWNAPHHNFLAELSQEGSQSSRNVEIYVKDQEIQDLKVKQVLMANDIQRLSLKTQNQEVELNRLRYFLKVQGIDPQAVLRGQTPANNEMLKKHAPEGLEWPDYLPAYPTPSPYRPVFAEVKEKIKAKGRGSKPEVARLVRESDPEEFGRMVEAGLPQPMITSVPQIELPKPQVPAFWTAGLAEPSSIISAKMKLKDTN